MATPTFPQMQHFFRLVEEGKINAENFQTFLGNPGKFYEDNGFPVIVDYQMTLADMIAAGKYDWKNDNITVEHFPINGEAAAEIKLRLVHLGRVASTKEIEGHITSLGLEPARIEHLLAFGAKYPDKQREFPVVALGSGWVGPDGLRVVPYLDEGDAERRLGLRWGVPTDKWYVSCRFLAVSK